MSYSFSTLSRLIVTFGNYKVPQWYRDAKFGIFIHWGIYSVPAFGNEWYSRNMYMQGSDEFEHHVKTYGNHKDFGYKDFIPMFTADKFDAQEWADLFQKSGAKYVVPVAEHHDGFQMYKSDLSHWNSYEMGSKRDILGELSQAFQERNIENGASSHRVEHWFFMTHGKELDSVGAVTTGVFVCFFERISKFNQHIVYSSTENGVLLMTINYPVTESLRAFH